MKEPEKILFVDDQSDVRDYVSRVLSGKGFRVILAEDTARGLARFREAGDALDLVILDLDLGGGKDGLDLLTRMRHERPEIPVIMLTGKGTMETAVEALKRGAQDFLVKDLYIEEHLDASMEKVKRLLAVVDENRRLRGEVKALEKEADLYQGLIREKYQIVGASPGLAAVIEKAKALASIPRPVLIRGERGSGKELVAATIHYHGARAKKPFVTVNCAAFSGTLLESEMFGHEKGAFTGAEKRKIGRFEVANGGTLFLDEIGSMTLEFQEKMLRVIEYQTFERVGGTEPITVDVRVIAATNANLEEMMEHEKFRRDLHDRLAFETIRVPPLRERPEDVAPLARYFAQRFAAEIGVPPKTFSDEALTLLARAPWPGNVRQLKNVVERLCYSVKDDVIRPLHLPVEALPGAAAAPRGKGLKDRIEALERQLLSDALDETRGNQKDAAEVIGLTYDQFRHLYKKYRIGKGGDAAGE